MFRDTRRADEIRGKIRILGDEICEKSTKFRVAHISLTNFFLFSSFFWRFSLLKPSSSLCMGRQVTGKQEAEGGEHTIPLPGKMSFWLSSRKGDSSGQKHGLRHSRRRFSVGLAGWLPFRLSVFTKNPLAHPHPYRNCGPVACNPSRSFSAMLRGGCKFRVVSAGERSL